MKVKELIEKLKGCDPNANVLVSSDSEGSCFEHLNYVADELYIKRDSGGVEVVSSDDFLSFSRDGEIVHEGIFLWP